MVKGWTLHLINPHVLMALAWSLFSLLDMKEYGCKVLPSFGRWASTVFDDSIMGLRTFAPKAADCITSLTKRPSGSATCARGSRQRQAHDQAR